MTTKTTFPPEYKWGGHRHSELLAERQELLNIKLNSPESFHSGSWCRLQSIRGILDAIEEQRELDYAG